GWLLPARRDRREAVVRRARRVVVRRGGRRGARGLHVHAAGAREAARPGDVRLAAVLAGWLLRRALLGRRRLRARPVQPPRVGAARLLRHRRSVLISAATGGARTGASRRAAPRDTSTACTGT